jgi:hypothetical protein
MKVATAIKMVWMNLDIQRVYRVAQLKASLDLT